ncbi:hypothetical protein [Actinomadura macrotermitis]|uniref:Uncharacterized protein n=1 Tax=Actinomadura macrotermitis TaxID=2585200 RepID=A0A7K0BTW1_9ACTN|nr:hypothetical protein [Actinomadura macrotermitis]MQY04134.1 hypothetical protein [Actinomadura macrotermitis]
MIHVTREQAMENAGRILAEARVHMATLTAREAAEEAFVPGGPSIDELEERIRALRAEQVAANAAKQSAAEAGQVLASARAHMARHTPRQAAEEAYVPDGPSAEELEERIRALRDKARRSQ